jgi:hypothetical protein
MTLGEHTDYGRLARSAAPTGAGCRHRSGLAGLVGALANWVIAGAKVQPVVLALED